MTETYRWGATPEEWELFSKTLGLTEALLPVVSNPHATISPGSSINILGKLPSTYNSKGNVSGFPAWQNYTSTKYNISDWSGNTDYGIAVNCKTIRAIDIDLADEQQVAEVVEIIENVVGHTMPIRYRESEARRLIPYYLKGNYTKRKLFFADETQIVEFLADGQQFVACGTHINQKKLEADEFPVERYEWWWPDENKPAIAEITPEEFEIIYSEIKKKFKCREARDQASRKNKLDKLHTNDPIAQQLFDKGVVLGKRPDGGLNITCPFAGEHTSDTGEASTSYFPPNTGGYEEGSIKCLHAHCSGRFTRDFYEAMGITPPMFDNLGDVSPPDCTKEGTKPKLINFHTLAAKDFTIRWLIKGIIPETAEVGMIYGPSGCGKSFMVMDMAYAIARGVPWRGFDVPHSGKVVYVASEGRNGLKMRIKAYEAEHDIGVDDTPPIFLLSDAPSLLKREEIKDLIDTINNEGGVRLVVIDTMSSSMPGGNENSSEDMSKVFAYCRQISQMTGAIVLLIHHSGKDQERGARGSSLMPQWVDFEMSIERDPVYTDRRSITVNKQRDAEDKATYGFTLKRVPIGNDEEGLPVESCVIEHTDILPNQIKSNAKGSSENAVLKAINKYYKSHGEYAGRDTLTKYAADMSKGKKRTFDINKTIDNMINKGILEELNGTIVEYRGE